VVTALSWWPDLPEGALIAGLALACTATLLLVIRCITGRRRHSSTDIKKASVRHNPTEASAVSAGPPSHADGAQDKDAEPVRTTKAFRLFVSSTFRDFGQERELLQTKVFPELDAYCAAKGYQFYPLDLRWGVNEEAQRDQRTAEICLGEVDAAKTYPPPNFLILIGDRYGWVPLPYAIGRDEFEALLQWLNDNRGLKPALDVGTVYQHDENYLIEPGLAGADPNGRISAYTLRSRASDPESENRDRWEELETALRGALQAAADALLRSGRMSPRGGEKYFASLTEQEISHGLLAGTHSIMSPSTSGAHGAQAIALVREIADHTSVSPEVLSNFVELDADRKHRLDSLKGRIRAELPDANLIKVRANLRANGELDQAHLEEVGAQIAAKLKAAVDKHIAFNERLKLSPNFALESERAEHREFCAEKCEVFVGRESNLAAIESYLIGSEDHPLVIYGPSGAGKSALMAEAIVRAERHRGPLVYRFIGASAASSDFRSLFVSLIEELAHRGMAAKPETLEDDDNKFTEQIRTLLESLPKGSVIFLDALDQIRSYRPAWLPPKLPSGAKLVVSVLNDGAYKEDSIIYEQLQSRLPKGPLPIGAFLEIEPLQPSDGREILIKLEGRERRLRDGQRDYILRQFECAGSSPLWLRTAFEIAESWKSTDKPGEGHQTLVTDTAALISQFIDGLTNVHHHERHLVVGALAYLAAAKDGLSAKELTEILSDDAVVMKAISSGYAQAKSLPPSVWVRLNRQLSPFLVEKRVDDQPLLHFFHRQVRQVAHDRYYEGPAKADLHAALGRYFDPRNPRRQGRADYDKRSLSELPSHLHGAQSRARLDQILVAPDWMQQKLNAFGPQILLADYDQYAVSDIQRLIGRTLRLAAGICARDPRQLLPQLLGRLTPHADWTASSFLDDARHHLTLPALITKCPTLTPPGAEIFRLEGHTGEVNALAVLPDGRLASGSNDKTIRLWDLKTAAETARFTGHTDGVSALVMLPDDQLASGSGDRTVRLWDPKTGAETARLVGHMGRVNALAVLPDGQLASGSYDDTVRLWDPKIGAETALLEGLWPGVTALAVLPDGQLAWGLYNGTIELWDPKTGFETARLEGHSDRVIALVVLPDGRLASGSRDQTIRLWDPKSGAETARLEGHTSEVNVLAVLPDGRLASSSWENRPGSSDWDNAIRLSDLKTGAATARLEGHTSGVSALAVLPDGRLASGARDQTIRVWDPKSGTETASPKSHTSVVLVMAVLPDGRLAQGSQDGVIQLWDLRSGAETARLEDRTGEIQALAVLPDGRLAFSISDNGPGPSDYTIRMWDPRTAAATARLKGHTGQVNALAVLPDGRLASGSDDNTIRVWDSASCAETVRLKGHTSQVLALAVLPDGRLASGSHDNTIRLWDPMTGAENGRLVGHTKTVKTVAVLPDGTLASGSYDHTIRLWDPNAGVEILRFEGHTHWVRALAVLPDGRLASGTHDQTIRLWNPKTGMESARLDVDAPLRCVAALPDGSLVAADDIGRLHWLEILN
jgi:WD40 repeat protein